MAKVRFTFGKWGCMRSLGLRLLFCSVLAPPVWATELQSDYFQLISRYVEKIENYFEGSWAYTYHLEDLLRQENRTVHRNLSKPFPQDEILLAVNGEAPTETQLRAHHRARERAYRRSQRETERSVFRSQENPELTPKERFLKMIEPESIQLVKQEGALLYLEFSAMEEGVERILENLRGTLILDTDQEYIRELRVHSTGPFTPFILSRVQDAYLSLRFALNQGVPMLSELSWRLQGYAFLIRNLDAEAEVVWLEINPVGT